jgi:alpha-beta hydrolase superfamily lysophospholipase
MAEEFEVTLKDGTSMKGWHWPSIDAKRNFVFITGMNEHAYRYNEMFSFFASKGVNVWAIDALGQGRNAASIDELELWPEDAFAKNVEGIHEAIMLAKANGLPTIQGGHSMGSFMTQARLERFPLDTEKTILIGSNGGQKGLMKIGYMLSCLLVHKSNWNKPCKALDSLSLGGYTKAVKNRKTDLDWLSVDEENVKNYIADPYCGHQNSGGFWREFLKGISKIWSKKELAKISKEERIYITAGDKDPVGRNGEGPKWLEATYKKLGVKDVTLKLYPGLRHEIHNEKEREQVWGDLLEAILN